MKKGKPLVLIVMGSDSDLPEMKKAADVLKDMGISYDMEICSAHRTPNLAADFARSAEKDGIKVIIAGAGMAAHLAGAFAANTTLPVIGVPLMSGALNGIDALLSTVQMPSGVPVGTMGINNAKNAAYFACSILSIKYPKIADKLFMHKTQMHNEVIAKSDKMKKEMKKKR